MNITLQPGVLAGSISVPSSKSMAHRMMICAAFGKIGSKLILNGINDDIVATAEALNQIGPAIIRTEQGFDIHPYGSNDDRGPASVYIRCHESGSTLRFLMPIVGALGINTIFDMEGRLPHRPLSPLWEEMERMGCQLSRPATNQIQCTGQLRPGHYRMDGGVSSQFISGLMMALPLIAGKSSLEITGQVESRPYIEMTRSVLASFRDSSPAQIEVEGDWSSAAFWLAANSLGSRITMQGLNETSPQGDRKILELLPKLGKTCIISAADIPDLVPILAVVAAARQGATFTDVRRLRLKESDRIASVIAMLESLGGQATATENTLTVHGTGLRGGTADSFGDHRIAMAAAIAATVCAQPVTILGAECVKKSYPSFWEHRQQLQA